MRIRHYTGGRGCVIPSSSVQYFSSLSMGYDIQTNGHVYNSAIYRARILCKEFVIQTQVALRYDIFSITVEVMMNIMRSPHICRFYYHQWCQTLPTTCHPLKFVCSNRKCLIFFGFSFKKLIHLAL